MLHPMISNNPVAMVTGGSGGTIHAVAVALAMDGYDVVLQHTDDEAEAQAIAKECDAASKREGLEVRTLIVRADISSIEDRARLFEMADVFGERLDLLVCCGPTDSGTASDFMELEDEPLDRALACGVQGPFHVLQIAAEWMQELREDGGFENYTPMLLLVTSTPARLSGGVSAIPSIVAAARGAMTSLFAERLGALGIPVHEIRTGLMDMEMPREAKEEIDHQIGHGQVPIRRWGQPEDVAEAVVSLASGAFPYSTGQVVHIDGGLHLRNA